jgi:hypothetical protein
LWCTSPITSAVCGAWRRNEPVEHVLDHVVGQETRGIRALRQVAHARALGQAAGWGKDLGWSWGAE